MNILDLKQGTDEWKSARLRHYTASEAPAMMGVSPYISREELLAYKTSGVEQEVTSDMQYIFDKGHYTEAKARPLAELAIGEDLYPVTGSETIEGLPLLASFDGLTMFEDDGFEHKQWNTDKAQKITDTGDLEPLHYWQLEQQMLVADIDSILFVMSDGTKEKWVEFRYESKPERRKALIAGWKQFQEDLQNYEPKVYAEKPEATPVLSLPAITYKLDGLALTSNLDVYKTAAEKLVQDAKKPMETDQDFANRELLVKKFKDAEAKIKTVQEQVLGEITDVDAFSKDLGYIGEMIRASRLTSEKAIKTQKESIKTAIAAEHTEILSDYIHDIDDQLPEGISLSALGIDDNFLAAMKGKKTVKSLNEAAGDLLAKAKILVNAEADKLKTNSALYQDLAKDYYFLFPDVHILIHKDSEFLSLTIKNRIFDHNAREEERLKEEPQKEPEQKEPEPVTTVLQPIIVEQKTNQTEDSKASDLSPIESWAKFHGVSDDALSDLFGILGQYGLNIDILKAS